MYICVKDCSESCWLATPLCTGFPTFNIPFQRLKNSTEPPVSPIMAWLWKDSPKVRECSNSCHFVQKAKKQAGAHFKDEEALVHPSCEADVNASKLWTMVAANSLWLALCLQQPASNLGNLQFLSSNMNILGTNAKNSFYKYRSENRVIFENWLRFRWGVQVWEVRHRQWRQSRRRQRQIPRLAAMHLNPPPTIEANTKIQI